MAADPIAQPAHAQFWDDFWNTLHQFAHPFSSTFFDSFFADTDNNNNNNNNNADNGPTSSQSSSGPLKETNTPSGPTQFFKDEPSFQKFWHGLQSGHHESHLASTPLEHIQAAWLDFKSASWGFISSVEWQQTWIQMIMALHMTLFVIIIVLRNRPNPLAAMLFCTILLAALSEPLNGIGSRHWQLFSDDNYFDSHGVFTSLVWATPLLGNALLAVLLLLRATVKLLVKVKRAQLKESRNKKQE